MSGDVALDAFFVSDDPDEVIAAAHAVEGASHGVVRTPETVYARTGKPERDGLICAKIFGPIADHRCLCGKLASVEHAGDTCDKCGVLCGDAALRDVRWAHVVSPAPLLHPVLVPRIAELLGVSERTLTRVARGSANLHDDGKVVLAKRSEFGGMTFDDEEEDALKARGLGYLHRRLLALDAARGELMPTLVPVPPAGWRGGARDAQDVAYGRLINRANRYARLVELDAPPIIIENEERLLFQRFVALHKVVRRELRARAAPSPRPRDAEREAALLSAIRADPSDDAARAVYADFLLAHGDPRGEFISLQLRNVDAARLPKAESELLRRHFEQWMGPLASAAARDGHVVFRRGFPVSMKVDDKRVGEVIGDPAWATLEHVESGSPELLVDASLRALERVSTNFRTLRSVSTRSQQLPGVRVALVRMRSTPPAGYPSVVDREVLPALRDLTLISSGYRDEEDWSWLDGAPLTRQLERLTVASTVDHLGELSLPEWLDFLARHPRLEALSLTFSRKALCFDISRVVDRAPRLTVSMSDRFLEFAAMASDEPDDGLAPLLAGDARLWSAVRVEANAQWFDELFVERATQLREHFGAKIELPEPPAESS